MSTGGFSPATRKRQLDSPSLGRRIPGRGNRSAFTAAAAGNSSGHIQPRAPEKMEKPEGLETPSTSLALALPTFRSSYSITTTDGTVGKRVTKLALLCRAGQLRETLTLTSLPSSAHQPSSSSQTSNPGGVAVTNESPGRPQILRVLIER
jgi:hypothetical protein